MTSTQCHDLSAYKFDFFAIIGFIARYHHCTLGQSENLKAGHNHLAYDNRFEATGKRGSFSTIRKANAALLRQGANNGAARAPIKMPSLRRKSDVAEVRQFSRYSYVAKSKYSVGKLATRLLQITKQVACFCRS